MPSKSKSKPKQGLTVPRVGRPHLPKLTKEERAGLRAFLRRAIEWGLQAEERVLRAYKRTGLESYYLNALYYRHGAAFCRGLLGRIEYWLRRNGDLPHDNP